MDFTENLSLLSELTSETIQIDNLFVNPNNPRLMEKKRSVEVADSRIIEENVQDNVLKETVSEGITDLVQKMKRLGFLTIDRIVVREVKDNPGKYVVLEGNRRISTVKTLIKQHKAAEISLNDKVYDSMQNIEALVYGGTDKDIIWLLQGMRHINGVKEWGPLQQSRFLYEMQKKQNLRATELDKMTALGRNSIANKIRSYKAYQYCKEVYHGDIEEDQFSIFSEAIFARPIIKDWLEWNDESGKFENDTNLDYILNWYLGDEDGNKRIGRALDLRDFLNQALQNENKSFFKKFINNPELSSKDIIQEINAKDAVKDAQKNQLDLQERLEELDEISATLNTLPTKKIVDNKELREDFIQKLSEIGDTATFSSQNIKSLSGKE